MNGTRTVIAIVGIALTVYLGVWLCFIGGIVQIIETIKITPIDSVAVALGFLRIVCAGFVSSMTLGITYILIMWR